MVYPRQTYPFICVSVKEFDHHLAHFAETTFLQDTGDFGNMRCRTWLSFGEDVDKVGGHSLLCDENLLGTVDDEVTALKDAPALG
jgi:hypothetical protein